MKALKMWCWRKMKRSWTERNTTKDILKTIKEKRTLIDTIKNGGGR